MFPGSIGSFQPKSLKQNINDEAWNLVDVIFDQQNVNIRGLLGDLGDQRLCNTMKEEPDTFLKNGSTKN